MRIFLAGATGVIGRSLVPLLIRAGHDITGTTRSPERAAALEAQGVAPALVDAYDAAGMRAAVEAARPDIVIHQLTDLPRTLDPAQLNEALAANARLRIETTPHLMAAAKAAGARRVIAQSIAFVYAPGREPHAETDALDVEGRAASAVTVAGVVALERAVTQTPGIEGIVLRYGRLYGPGTWTALRKGAGPLHVEAAAQAAMLALTRGAPGLYNVAEDDGAVAIGKARRELGFDPDFRIG